MFLSMTVTFLILTIISSGIGILGVGRRCSMGYKGVFFVFLVTLGVCSR